MTASPQEFDVALHSGRVHLQRFGSAEAPPVFCLHGLTLHMRAFDFLGEQLGHRRQVIALDLRGRGMSETTAPGTYGWENHANDVLALADHFGFEHFSVIGQSMGGSIAMKLAELSGSRVDSVVLLDVAGRVDPGVGPVIGSIVAGLEVIHPSVDAYLDTVRSAGLIGSWNEYWERCYRDHLVGVEGGVRPAVSSVAVAEDRAYGHTQHPYERWRFLTMPTLLVRALKEMAPGSGLVVPADDRDAFLSQVPQSRVAEIEASHLTIGMQQDTADAVRVFLDEVVPTPLA